MSLICKYSNRSNILLFTNDEDDIFEDDEDDTSEI